MAVRNAASLPMLRLLLDHDLWMASSCKTFKDLPHCLLQDVSREKLSGVGEPSVMKVNEGLEGDGNLYLCKTASCLLSTKLGYSSGLKLFATRSWPLASARMRWQTRQASLEGLRARDFMANVHQSIQEDRMASSMSSALDEDKSHPSCRSYQRNAPPPALSHDDLRNGP